MPQTLDRIPHAAPHAAGEPTITCPNCQHPVRLTEALAAPLLASTRAGYERRLQQQTAEFDQRNAALLDRERHLSETRQHLQTQIEALKRQQADQQRLIAAEVTRQTDAQLAQRLQSETQRIIEQEQQRAERRFTDRLAEHTRNAQDDAARIGELEAKLTSAQKTEAAMRLRERALADRERELDLQVEETVSGKVAVIRAEAEEHERTRVGLQLEDKDRKIQELSRSLEELQRKAQQGSQQAQGETLELVLEEHLRRNFPFDEIQPVPKGEFGGDTVQIVRDSTGRECGRILWEFKRTRNWNADWLPKLRGDQRSARADLAVIVSQAMPPDIRHFSEVDGVWVSSLACTIPVASALRASLVQLGSHRRVAEGQQTKSQLVYAYLTGPQFRGRIEAIAERWQDMRDDLQSEQKATKTRWAKREKQLETLLDSTTGIWGDLQGIAGRDVGELEALRSTLLLES